MIEFTDNSRAVTIRDGRCIGILELGDPQGFPVFYFHGTPSSRYEAVLVHPAAKHFGYRLIGTERPGMGLSSFQPGREFRDWARDIASLADALGIEKFGLVGHSGAGPHLFVCALEIPERLAFVSAFCPWGPVASPEVRADLNFLDSLYSRVASAFPGLMRLAFAPVGWMARRTGKLFYKTMLKEVCETDRIAMLKPGVEEDFMRAIKESFVQGARGPAREAAICYRKWDFDIADIDFPVRVWLGDKDIFVPKKMGELMEAKMPNAVIHWMEDTGHMRLEKWRDVFADTAAWHRASVEE